MRQNDKIFLFFVPKLDGLTTAQRKTRGAQCAPETVKKLWNRPPRLSSGGCVQGEKAPCAFNKTGFSNFLGKFEKPHSGAKTLF